MVRSFWAVRLVAALQILVGALLICVSVFMVLVSFGVLTTGVEDKIPAGGISLAIGVGLFLGGVFAIAQGQLLEVFLQIEENTRK